MAQFKNLGGVGTIMVKFAAVSTIIVGLLKPTLVWNCDGINFFPHAFS